MFFIMNPSCDHLSGFLLIFNSIQLTNSATFNKHRDIVMHSNPEKIYQQLFSIVLRIPQCIYWLILPYIGIYLLFSVFSSNNESINWFTLTNTMIQYLVNEHIIAQTGILIISSYSIRNLIDIRISLLPFKNQLVLNINRQIIHSSMFNCMISM